MSEAMALLVSGLVSPRTHQAADGHGSKAHHAAADAGFRIVIRGFEVVDVLRQFLRVFVPVAGLIDLVQVGIENDDRLERKDLVHQFGQVAARARRAGSSAECGA